MAARSAEAQSKVQRTRERILEAGDRVITAKSYNGAGLKEILEEAGVPKGSFYHAFRSKEDFGIALIERSGDAHARRMRELLSDRSQSPKARLRSFFEAMRTRHIETGPTRRCFVAKLALEVSQLNEPMRAAIKCAYDSWTSILAQTIREAQAAGEVCRDHDPERLAGALQSLWEGATIRMQIDRDLSPLDDAIRLIFDGPMLEAC